ncbi:hypothetical protein IW262DRAFT_1496358 [Armillaria fumosa]|nr:hypothetical protein IW262DRAFT_1496358 [Armillaria fumosa]
MAQREENPQRLYQYMHAARRSGRERSYLAFYMASDPPADTLLGHQAVNSAFTNATETRNGSSFSMKANTSYPVEPITRNASALPHPYHDLNGHNWPNGIPKHDSAPYKCSRFAKKYDKGVCKDWKEEIDTLLVFAGLFSAVATAFIIDSYKWLLSTDSDATFLPAQVRKRINIYWFSSLLLALSSASTGMLYKQWLREYIRDVGRSSIDTLSIRQMRLEGLSAWKVKAIIATIPLFLQAALLLFFIGVLELLWPLEKTVAIPLTIIVAIVVLFLLFTTIAPSAQYCYVILHTSSGHLPPQCLYKSSQAWVLVKLLHWIFSWLITIRPVILQSHHNFSRLDQLLRPKLGEPRSLWKIYDLYWVKGSADTDASVMTRVAVEPYLGRYISWLMRHFDSPKLQTRLYHVFWNSIQSYAHRTHVSLPPENGEAVRRRDTPPTDSNQELITYLVVAKRDELPFEAVEDYETYRRVPKAAPGVLLGTYDEWLACSRDAQCESRCNAHFTGASLLYLSSGSGLSGL